MLPYFRCRNKTVGGLLLARGGDSMTNFAFIGLVVAILSLIVEVISLCYTIFVNKK